MKTTPPSALENSSTMKVIFSIREKDLTESLEKHWNFFPLEKKKMDLIQIQTLSCIVCAGDGWRLQKV